LVFFSDLAVDLFISGPVLHTVTGVLKDGLFVLVTAWLLYQALQEPLDEVLATVPH